MSRKPDAHVDPSANERLRRKDAAHARVAVHVGSVVDGYREAGEFLFPECLENGGALKRAERESPAVFYPVMDAEQHFRSLSQQKGAIENSRAVEEMDSSALPDQGVGDLLAAEHALSAGGGEMIEDESGFPLMSGDVRDRLVRSAPHASLSLSSSSKEKSSDPVCCGKKPPVRWARMTEAGSSTSR